MIYRRCLNSPVGHLTLVCDETHLLEVNWEKDEAQDTFHLLLSAEKQLNEYFDGKREVFDLPLNPRGTRFQLEVWKRLQGIPFGSTMSYGELAQRIGRPKAARAVGAANGKNPLPIIIPCHRVIGHNGNLVGFLGGVKSKELLLRLETV